MFLGSRRDKMFDYRYQVTMQMELPIELSFFLNCQVIKSDSISP